MLFVVSGLVCNEIGVAKRIRLRSAMADPAVLEVAMGFWTRRADDARSARSANAKCAAQRFHTRCNAVTRFSTASVLPDRRPRSCVEENHVRDGMT